MRHSDLEYLDEVDEELKLAVLEKIPAEDRVRGLSLEERLQGLSPEERLQGLSEEDLARLRALLERPQGN